MTNSNGSSLPPAGWYPDPAGSTQQRWWDGTQWTQYLQPTPQPAQRQYPPQQAYGQQAYGQQQYGQQPAQQSYQQQQPEQQVAQEPVVQEPVAQEPEQQAAAPEQPEQQPVQQPAEPQQPAQPQFGQYAPQPDQYGAQQAYQQYGQQQYQPYAASAPAVDYGQYSATTIEQPDLGPEPKIYPPFIWVIVLLPLLSSIALLFVNMREFARPSGSLQMLGDPAYLTVSLLGYAIYGVTVWMAYLDWKALGRIGVVRPFHWAWAFLGSLVYVIGRTVVVRRRIGGGAMLPIWIMIAVFIIGMVISIVKITELFSALMTLTYSSF